MLLEEAFYQLMKTNDGVKLIFNDRLYPVKMPQLAKGENHYPAAVYALVDRNRGGTHDGPDGLTLSHYGLYIFAPGYLQNKRAADAMRRALDGKGKSLASIYGDHVRRVWLEDEFDDDEAFDKVEELALYRVTQHVIIQHREAVDG